MSRRAPAIALSAMLLASGARAAPGPYCATVDAAPAAALVARARHHLQDAPDPQTRLHTEGTLPHHGIYDQSVIAAHDFARMRDDALAWRVTGDPAFARHLDRSLAAWLARYRPDLNPIDETNLDALIVAVGIGRDGLSAATSAAAGVFLRGLAEGYLARIAARFDETHSPHSATWTNNWQSHRIKLVTLAAVALGDRALLDRAQALFVAQLAANVAPDGQVRDFALRDALHYVVFDLEPLTAAALAAHAVGRDWLHLRSAGSGSLADALGWLEPYADGERPHDEFAHTTVAFDRERAAAGVPGFTGVWDRSGAATLYWLAARLDARDLPLARALAPNPPDWLAVCQPAVP